MKSQYSVSEFKAVCLKVIDTIQRTGQSVIVTRHGQPAVEINPIRSAKRKKYFGAAKRWVKHIGDIETPLGPDDWEALR